MGIFVICIVSQRFLFVLGGLLLSISHGLCSSCLFFFVGNYYESLNSRNIIVMRGLIWIFRVLCFGWILVCLANCSFPSSLNLFSEIFLLLRIRQIKKIFIFFVCLKVFIGGLFCLFLVTKIKYKKWNKKKTFIKINTKIFNTKIFNHLIILYCFFILLYSF